MQIRLYLSANAGVGIDMDGTFITVDAFHSKQYRPYSTVGPEYMKELMENPVFRQPDIVAYSHCHQDHFGLELTRQVLSGREQAALIIPESVGLNGIILKDDYEEHHVGDVTVKCIKTLHDGEEYADVPNYAYVMEKDGIRILHTGDSCVKSEQLERFLDAEGPVDLALMNFPWLALGRGRRFIEEFIKPQAIAAIHLPFADEDEAGYNAMLGRCLGRWPMGDVRVMNAAGQCEVFNLEKR